MHHCSVFVEVELLGPLAWCIPRKVMAFFSLVFIFVRDCSVFERGI